jgi:RHS repeat-associated protein
VLKLKRGTTVAAYHSDGLGSVASVTDATSGGSLKTYRYDAFGKPLAQTGTLANAYTYTGREQDGSGLYYYRARYYLPSAGRFLTPDPIGLAGGINAYTYVRSNPVNYTDPFGLMAGRPMDPAAPNLPSISASDPSFSRTLSTRWALSDAPGDYLAAIVGSVSEWQRQEGIGEPNAFLRFLHNSASELTSPANLALNVIMFGAGSGGRVGTEAGEMALASARSTLLGFVASRARSLAGFSDEGLPLIVDASVGVTGGPNMAALTLREAGLNARSVQEIFGTSGLGDDLIRELAEVVGGRVVTFDKTGFGQLAIRPRGQLRDPAELVRYVTEELRR